MIDANGAAAATVAAVITAHSRNMELGKCVHDDREPTPFTHVKNRKMAHALVSGAISVRAVTARTDERWVVSQTPIQLELAVFKLKSS